MEFQAFHELFPDVAQREVRSIEIPDPGTPLPPATYQFVEQYCNQPGCDCRRVMFSVFSSLTQQFEAVVAWGWDSLDYYRRWLRFDDPAVVEEMQGPVLNLASAQGPLAGAILSLTRDVLLKDPEYVERIKRHYRMFRERIDEGQPVHVGRRPSLATMPSPKMRAAQRRRRRRSR